jgi:hypothetical protein
MNKTKQNEVNKLNQFKKINASRSSIRFEVQLFHGKQIHQKKNIFCLISNCNFIKKTAKGAPNQKKKY